MTRRRRWCLRATYFLLPYRVVRVENGEITETRWRKPYMLTPWFYRWLWHKR